MSKEAICMMKPKKTPALGGKLTLNKGCKTISCCVLIIDQSYCRDADKSMLTTMLPAMNTFVVDDIVSAAAAI